MNRIATRPLQKPVRIALYSCLPAILLLAGCGPTGPEMAPVSGRVMLDGRPLEHADVVFQPDDARRPSYGHTDAEGHYDLVFKRGISGGMVGPNTVRITVSSEIVRNPPPIPAEYNTQSELKVEVKSGEDNVFDFNLKTEGE